MVVVYVRQQRLSTTVRPILLHISVPFHEITPTKNIQQPTEKIHIKKEKDTCVTSDFGYV